MIEVCGYADGQRAQIAVHLQVQPERIVALVANFREGLTTRIEDKFESLDAELREICASNLASIGASRVSTAQSGHVLQADGIGVIPKSS